MLASSGIAVTGIAASLEGAPRIQVSETYMDRFDILDISREWGAVDATVRVEAVEIFEKWGAEVLPDRWSGVEVPDKWSGA